MRLRDFEYRFEETLKANKLEFTIKTTTEAVIGITWTWKTYSIKPRSSFDLPLLVTLCKCYREGSAYARRRARTSCSCFVVPPHGLGDKAVHGLNAVWRFIRLMCLPL